MLDLAEHAIFLALAGSQAHGTARAGSDVDIRGVCVAPLPVRLSLRASFEQLEGGLEGELAERVRTSLASHPTASSALGVKTESVIYDIAKLLRLCANANPTALEILFADERDWLLETPLWRRVHAERFRFLTKKVQHTYLGYAMAQLKRIETHRAWLRSPPDHPPTRAEFGLPDASTMGSDDRDRLERAVVERIRSYGIDTLELAKGTRIELEARMRAFQADVLAVDDDALDERRRSVATAALHLPSEVAGALEAERRYRGALRRWEAYRAWKAARNPSRAALEERFGYDTKHAMHLVRLMRTGLETLTTGELRVRRPDADELLAIRDGALDFEGLLAHARDLEARVKAAAISSRLPEDVDLDAVSAILVDVVRATV